VGLPVSVSFCASDTAGDGAIKEVNYGALYGKSLQSLLARSMRRMFACDSLPALRRCREEQSAHSKETNRVSNAAGDC